MTESSSPLGEAIRADTELRMFIETAVQGLGWAANATKVHDVLKKSPLFPIKDDTQERQRAEQAERFGQEQASKGFPYLWYLASVRLWAILEVAVDDMALDALNRLDLIPPSSLLHTLEGPLLPFAGATADIRASLLLELLEEKCRSRFKPGVSRFEAVLDPLGLGGPVNDDVRKILLELSQARNLIMHRNGIVDKRFAEACPWIGAADGSPLPLVENHYMMYGLATSWYILELDRRLRVREGLDASEEAIEFQRDLEKKLRCFLASRPLGV